MSRIRPTVTAVIVLLVAPAVLAAGFAAAADPCADGADHVWFVGIVYDPDYRQDFILDVDNFETFLAKLRTTYCIPDSQARILAFDNNWVRNGKTYPAATEGALKTTLADFGAAASPHSDALVFVFLSSHGNVWPTACGGLTHVGSFSALKSSPGQDGYLDDCELGGALNSRFDADTRMVVFVDCSFCGGFSDSLTAASGTIRDDDLPRSAGVVGPNRIVMTGCAITTECFGSSSWGGISYLHFTRIIRGGVAACDGWTAPGFPLVQGFDAPVRTGPLDGACSMSEWFFAAVNSAYVYPTPLFPDRVFSIEQQFRIKYNVASDVPILLGAGADAVAGAPPAAGTVYTRG